MGIEKEREYFEAWYCRKHTGLKQSDLAKFRTLSSYSFSDSLKINISWEAWQAAKAVPDGYKVVPVNYECVWCGCTELDGWTDEAMLEAQEQK